MSSPRLTLAAIALTSSLGCLVESAPSDPREADPSPSPSVTTQPDGDAGVAPPDASPTNPTSCKLQIPPGGVTSAWASIGHDGKLSYAKLPTGERLLDFSYAGYRGGGVALPVVPAVVTLHPSGGDDTGAIQKAIDDVSKRPSIDGVRGAIALAAGTYRLDGAITISASGVVLRGAGSANGGTVLQVGGAPRTILTVVGVGGWQPQGKPTAVTDAYVPSGTRSFHVADASGLAVGARVLVDRPVTAAWIHFMGMDRLVRDGAPQTWLSTSTVIHADRVITAIAGDEITVDAPLSDSFDAKYTQARVVPYAFPGRITEVGVEGLRVVAPAQSVPIDQATFALLSMDAVEDGWVRDVAGEEVTTGIVLQDGVKRVTVDGASIVRTTPLDGSAGWPFHYSVAGQQTLIVRSSSKGDRPFPFATQARTSGPNVVLDFHVEGAPMSTQPHQRWATGLLIDGLDARDGNLSFVDRGNRGSGHGWTIGFSVAWNPIASDLVIQRPPGSMNWAIGARGKRDPAYEPNEPTPSSPEPEGTFDAYGTEVAPKSLYLAQLCERLGPDAVTAIGYTSP
jgi:hypothetical protein